MKCTFIIAFLIIVTSRLGQAQFQDAVRTAFDSVLIRINNNENIFDPFGVNVDSLNIFLAPALGLMASEGALSLPQSTSISLSRYRQEGRTRDMLGALFGELGETLGAGNLDAGLTYAYSGVSRIRGVAAGSLAFLFAPENQGGEPIVGDIPSEQDLLAVDLDVRIRSHFLSLHAARGFGDTFEVSASLLAAAATYEIGAVGRLMPNSDTPVYFFNDDQVMPELTTRVLPQSESSFILAGAVARIKYRLPLNHPLLRSALVLRYHRFSEAWRTFYGGGERNSLQAVATISADGYPREWLVNAGILVREGESLNNKVLLRAEVAQKLFFLDENVDAVFSMAGVLDTSASGIFSPLTAHQLLSFTTIETSNLPRRSRDYQASLALGVRYAWKRSASGFIATTTSKGVYEQNISVVAGISVNNFAWNK